MKLHRWFSLQQIAIKYGMDIKTAKRWVNGQGIDCYRIHTLRTPSGKRYRDPELDFPPHRTAPPTYMFIFGSREMAQIMKVTQRDVNKLAKKGRLRFRVYGNKRFFPVSEALRVARIRLKEFL